MARRDTETILNTLELLKSNKAKERQQGLSAIEAAFERDPAVNNFDRRGDGRPWLAVFQALFEAFATELKICVSKTGVFPTQTSGRGLTAVRRLGEVASVVRWLTERSLERLNSRVLKSLLMHLTHGIVYRGELLAPVALSYAKTIKAILSHKPHLYALKDQVWHEIIALAFNVVLARKPKRTLAEVGRDDDGMDVDPAEEEDDVQSAAESEGAQSAGPSTLRSKRRRQGSLPPNSTPRRTTPTIHRTSQPVSLKQIEFMSIIAILLHSPSAPILVDPDEAPDTRREQGRHTFPSLLLDCFSQFLRVYSGDTSLHHDYLIALCSALSHLAINCRGLVRSFAAECWNALVGMWGTKNQRMKEDLVVVLRLLFPLLTAEPLEGETEVGLTNALVALWSALDGDAHSRWGVPGLSLESLQLRLVDRYDRELSEPAFIAETFQYGWQFDTEQALSWAILELQADCAEKLYQCSESTYSSATTSGKRLKLENPVASLLASLRSQESQQVRIHHLQVLMFFVDRHWHILHDQLRHDVITTLVSLVSFEDAIIQSWTFLCLAAIACSESSTPSIPPTDAPSLPNTTSVWDPIWTHAMRRANVPAVSRAACHAAHSLLMHSKRLLSSQRVLLEIESFVKDLDVQGPAYPYDSVCDFMVLCLRFANQDVRLYRMQMEEKVLTWLMESWRIGGERRTSMPLHTSAHIHTLLEGITGSSKRVKLRCGMMLPHCAIVDALVEETQTKVIRDFQLHARLPPYLRSRDASATKSTSPMLPSSDSGTGKAVLPFGDSIDLVPPRGRERRLSAFLLKSLEETSLTLDQRDGGYVLPTAEKVRASLDLTIIALCYEASLLMNGTQSNRRVLQAACKLLGSITPFLTDTRWKTEERRLILDALDPLIRVDEVDTNMKEWETLVPPGERTGIRTQVLRKLLSASRSTRPAPGLRRDLQRFVFRSADVQDAFTRVLESLRDVLRLSVGQILHKGTSGRTLVDDSDGFGPVRTTHTTASSVRHQDDVHTRHVVDTCMTALAVIPILQSSSGEPTRDQNLTELVLSCEPDEFLVLGPAYCEQVSRRTLHFSSTNLAAILAKLDQISAPYALKHSEETQLLIVRILDAISPLWLQPSIASSSLGQKARFYCREAVQRLKNKAQRSWRVPDAIILFLDGYLAKDPNQEIWRLPIADELALSPDDMPAALLPTFGEDYDIRIRFRVAATSPRLLTVGRLAGRDPMVEVYHDIHSHLSNEQDRYESILTRLLCLGNMVIADASIRRGAYWHLLEIAFFSGTYLPHLKAILTGIVERMGIETLSGLFNCYASQFAYSIRRAHIDLFKFPPDLLGYRNRRECAEATFRAFTPTNLLAEGSSDEIEYGRDLFARHCQVVKKTEKAGIEECFPELVAHEIVFWLHRFSDTEAEELLDEKLREKTGYVKADPEFHQQLARHTDGIVVSLLRSLGDQDVSPNGSIVEAIQISGQESVLETFRAITQYRSLDIFETHEPNLPFYSTNLVLHAVEWYRSRVRNADSPAVTYHVLHQLFADIELSPLVNEQHRLLNAVCLWIACHHKQFQDECLLRTLTRCAVTMLAQVDLARGCQSLLDWCLSLYRMSSIQADYRLADVLIRISTIAHDFLHTKEDTTVIKLGSDLLSWAERQADVLRRNKYLKKQVIRALAAWPRELPPSLRSACEDVTLTELTSVLVDHGVSASKFRLVRRIHNLASQCDSDEHFGSSDFWRLKVCIPQERYLVDSDIDAFTSLLMLHHGQVDTIESDQYDPETVRTVHRATSKEKSGPIKEHPPHVGVQVAHVSIVASLRSMLDTSSAPQVGTAYRTLRSLMSNPRSESYIDPTWSKDVRRELEYLQAFSKPLTETPILDLRAVLMGEVMLHLAQDFDAWISRLTATLCEFLGTQDPFFSPLVTVVQTDRGFAEEVLPVLVHSLLQIEHDSTPFGGPGWLRNLLSEYFTSVLSYGDAAAPCFRAIISVILHLRNFQPSADPKPLAHNEWLSVDFTLLSRCAIQCNAYTTALLFLELAAEYRSSENVAYQSAVENILFEIYSHIDEPDGFYGIQTDDLRSFFARRLRHENQWDKAFRYHGAVIESGSADPSNTDGIVQSLYSFGFNQLALNTMQTLFTDTSATAESSALAYNLGWRAETWDLPENLSTDGSGTTLYLALRAVHRERSVHVVDAILQRAFIQEMGRLRDLGNENFTEIRQVTQNLMCLNQVRQWRSDAVQKGLQSRCVDVEGIGKFAQIEPAFDFANIEAIMATRLSLIRSVRQKEQRDQIGDLTSPFCDWLLDLEKSCHLRVSERAREVGQSQIALNSVIRAQGLEKFPSSSVSQEFANVLWLAKEHKLAIKSLGSLTSAISWKPTDDLGQRLNHALLLARLGAWSAEASTKNPSQIVAECFAPAVELVLNCNAKESPPPHLNMAMVFHQYALFAERQYLAVAKSSDALRFKLYIDRKKEEIKQRHQQIKRMTAHTKERQTLATEQYRAETLLTQDMERYEEHFGQRTSFLALAIEMYSRCLSASDKFDEDSPIRLCSLWLANFDNDDLAQRFSNALEHIPSRKLVFLAHQLTARLSKSEGDSQSRNQTTLQHIIQRMGCEHPFHSLFPLYCLRLDRSSSQASSSARRQSSRHTSPAPSQLERAAAVADLFDKLRCDAKAGDRVQAVESVCDASLEWAKYPIKHLFQKGKPVPSLLAVPDQLRIRRLKNVRVPVLTAMTPIDPTTEYRDCVWISHFDAHYSTAGGVNLPKIIKCFGNDGRSYKQLYKGEGDDDLRQDAVMEQVFDLVNVVLRHDRETRKRKLSVRGYKVIPLASQAGVLEFVENTTPLASWLRPAHARYKPKGHLTNEDFQKQLWNPNKKEWREDPQGITSRFVHLKERFKPVMRHYFMEKHKTPMSWFAMRLHYARSVATTSIVGHILGLGDRHTSNILMDNKTGEVVHIDLGIAFEQGKLLPQPERVPFRLTADMVDGMGISGTQGVFQRCAEETLRVLRDGSETILTVLEVFKYDPLHSWVASEFKIRRAQAELSAETAQLTSEAFRFAIGIDMASGATDEAADRALSTVARKLDKAHSVEYAVNELITEASNTANLALMYIGWAPHW